MIQLLYAYSGNMLSQEQVFLEAGLMQDQEALPEGMRRSRRRENFFYTAFRLLGRFLFVLALLSRGMGGGSRSRSSGTGPWGGGGSSPSSGGDV